MQIEKILWRGLSVVAILCIGARVSAATYLESGSGDLSNNQAAPTSFSLTSGANSITGTVGGSETQDWVALVVPSGFQMTTYTNAAYAGSDAQGFTGFKPGATFVGSPGSAGSYAGYAHFGTGATNPGVNSNAPTSTIGVNLLPSPYMAQNSPGGTAQGATGFTPPLAAGTYTFLIQQLGGNISYQFSMNVSAVPEPGMIGMMAAASLLMLRGRRLRMPPKG